MIRNPEQTRARLLEAATEEFAARGIAGARIDRIAEAGKANKAMIYAYFGSKDELFDAAFAVSVSDLLMQVRFDGTDLPGYAGRLFDCFEDNPRTLRLATWYQLERPQGSSLSSIASANDDKLAGIAKAQLDGVIPGRYLPVELLSLVRSIATSWSSYSHSTLAEAATVDRDRRRFAVTDAVRRLVEPAHNQPINKETHHD
jgi:AcrR family transcriptional regulator